MGIYLKMVSNDTGEVTYDLQYYSVKLYLSGTTNLSDFIGLELEGQTSLVKAKVILLMLQLQLANTLYVKYTKTGVGNQQLTMLFLKLYCSTTTLGNITGVCDGSQIGSANLHSGTYYINGFALMLHNKQ